MRTSQKNRVVWIDLAKGIAILLVIVGHTVSYESLVRGVIFSFHMPFFFLVSCLTFRMSETHEQFRKKTQKAFRHLIFPAVGLFLLMRLIEIIQFLYRGEIPDWYIYMKERFLMLLFSSGVDFDLAGNVVPAIGIIWFFIVLFLGRTLFDFLHLELNKVLFGAVLIILTGAGIALGLGEWKLPLSFDIALAIMPFFYVGNYLKKIDFSKNTLKWCLLCGIIWAASFAICYLNGKEYLILARRRYPLFPLCYVCAIAGTLALGYASEILSHWKIIAKPIIFLGKNSMYILWIHILDYLWKALWGRSGNNWVQVVVRIISDLLVFILVMSLSKINRRKG